MVLDRINKVVYAALSERTSHDLLLEFCDLQGFKLITFNAYQDFDKKKSHLSHKRNDECL